MISSFLFYSLYLLHFSFIISVCSFYVPYWLTQDVYFFFPSLSYTCTYRHTFAYTQLYHISITGYSLVVVDLMSGFITFQNVASLERASIYFFFFQQTTLKKFVTWRDNEEFCINLPFSENVFIFSILSQYRMR